ncbi:hypothetical protein [Massilia sp. S19_KUP03_FR1]|uniref:hypothetical protein n=1 Tax=Massilia sp. S19_KUP03_FR1 TaxID=3025503 RepID=UPI002FCDBA91
MDVNISPDDDFEFNRANIKNILAAYSALEKNESALINFVKNPDEYMEAALGPEEMKTGLHFHVHYDGVLYPADSAPSHNQLVFSSEIRVAANLIPGIKEIIQKKTLDDFARGGGAYCSGCKKCAIARVVAFPKPEGPDVK